MASVALALALSCFVTWAATPRVRTWALNHDIVDQPASRRVHALTTPRLGGVAILLGLWGAGLALGVAGAIRSTLPLGLFTGGALLCLVGAIDDARSLGPWRKLLAQMAAASIAYAAGYRIDALLLPWIGELSTGSLSYPLTLCWFVAVINAINLIDGLDGLAAGLALLVCLCNVLLAELTGARDALLLSACMAGALVGFLRHNFGAASIFMGDSGSLFVGFTLAALSLQAASTPGAKGVALLPAVVALGVPLFDVALAVVRRVRAGAPLFAADRGHVHHLLLERGYSARRAVIRLYSAACVLAAAALLLTGQGAFESGLALAFVVVSLGSLARDAGIWRRGPAVRFSRPARIEQADTCASVHSSRA